MLSMLMKIYCKNKNLLDATTENTFQLTPISFLEQVGLVIGSKMPSPQPIRKKWIPFVPSFIFSRV